MLASRAQDGIGLPLVGVIQRAFVRMRLDALYHLGSVVRGDWRRLDLTVTLDDAKHDHLACRAPATLAVAGYAERVVAFQRTFKRFTQLFRPRHANPYHAVETLNRSAAGRSSEALPVNGLSPNKSAQQLVFDPSLMATCVLRRVIPKAGAAPLAFIATVG